jgi:hypothetical protein
MDLLVPIVKKDTGWNEEIVFNNNNKTITHPSEIYQYLQKTYKHQNGIPIIQGITGPINRTILIWFLAKE